MPWPTVQLFMIPSFDDCTWDSSWLRPETAFLCSSCQNSSAIENILINVPDD